MVTVPEMPLSSTDRLTCPPEVLSRVLDGEAVLLHLGSGMYFGMNEVASRVWEKIQEGIAVSDAIDIITNGFEVDAATAHRDLERFVDALVEKHLCIVSPGPG